MHYSEKMKQEAEELRSEIAMLREGYQDILIYLSLPKFREDPMVNKGDIELRIQEILSR
jgi:hypothetical protein